MMANYVCVLQKWNQDEVQHLSISTEEKNSSTISLDSGSILYGLSDSMSIHNVTLAELKAFRAKLDDVIYELELES